MLKPITHVYLMTSNQIDMCYGAYIKQTMENHKQV